MANSRLPIGKTASVTALIFSWPQEIFEIFVGFVISAVSWRVFRYLICISLLLFVDGPAKCCNFRYFRSFRNN